MDAWQVAYVCFQQPSQRDIAQGGEYSEALCGGVPHGGKFTGVNAHIEIRFEAREGMATVPADVDAEEHLLVANYAWDANAFPG